MKNYFFWNVSNPAKSCLYEKSFKKICPHLISSWAASSSKSTCWWWEKSIWIRTVMLFETLNFGLWIQTTLETPERCVEDNNRRERWTETASSPEERPSSLSSPAVTALTASQMLFLQFPGLLFPHLCSSQRQKLIIPYQLSRYFIHLSFSFMFWKWNLSLPAQSYSVPFKMLPKALLYHHT